LWFQITALESLETPAVRARKRVTVTAELVMCRRIEFGFVTRAEDGDTKTG